MISWIQYRWTSLSLLVMALGALILFLYGFFPLKYHTEKLAHMDDLPNFIDGVSIDGQEVYNSGENSVILMVIDGLRYDFVTKDYMPYTDHLVKNQSACIYVTVADPPTVTMPRIKSPERKKEKAQWRRTINFWRDIFAMMTGSVSTFADVALNFGAPAVRGDSVLRSAHARGRRSVMYGDDTWLRLFPGLFAEYDGTTSFFVTDYTEVDNNVTRHLDNILSPKEDKKQKFDFLVLHYLGLDHIGHLEGARSPKIKPKLLEMDEVVKKIMTAMQKWDRTGVLLLCGDHGMRDTGGHGGATPSEVLVPLIVAKSKDFTCPHPRSHGGAVSQTDVAPSVSWLVRAPPPAAAAGRVLPALLPADPRQHLYLLHVLAAAAARQLPHMQHQEFYKQFQRAEKQFGQYLATGQESAAKIAKEFYDESLETMTKLLTESSVNFDMFAIGIGVILLYFLGISLLCVMLYSVQPENSRRISVTRMSRTSTAGIVVAWLIMLTITSIVLLLACFITETESNVCSFDFLWLEVFFSIAVAFTMTYYIIKTGLEKTKDMSLLKELNTIDYLLIFGTLLHPYTFFGTSFIEEEHMTWYFFWNTLMFFVLIRTLVVLVVYITKKVTGATEIQDKPDLEQRMITGIGILPKWILLIALHRYLRTMNQTGDRWLFLPDTADWLNDPKNTFYLQAHLVIGTGFTFVICLYNLHYTNNKFHIHSVLTIIATACILCYRVATNALDVFSDIISWDPVHIVDVFWYTLTIQFLFELFTYTGLFSRFCSIDRNYNAKIDAKEFLYNKRKEKVEDELLLERMEDHEPWNVDEVRLNMVRSLTHIMLNDLMLIVILLMKPHNVIMVPSIYATCMLTSKCLDHKLLKSRAGGKTEVADVISQTLAHIWIGLLFFFYQGNSNGLASVELGAGYVGLREYSEVGVAARVGLHTYAAPTLAGAAYFATLAGHARTWTGYTESVWRAINVFAFQRVYCVIIYCLVSAIFKDHLFVWTVFSPKLLYEFVSTVFTIQALVTIAEVMWVTHAISWLARVFTYKKL